MIVEAGANLNTYLKPDGKPRTIIQCLYMELGDDRKHIFDYAHSRLADVSKDRTMRRAFSKRDLQTYFFSADQTPLCFTRFKR